MGEMSQAATADAAKAGWISGFWFWLFRTRNGCLTIWLLLALSAHVFVLWTHVFGPGRGILDSAAARIAFIGGTSVLILPVLLMFLNSKDNLQKGPGLLLPVLSLLILVTLTGVGVADAVFDRGALLGVGRVPSSLAELFARAVFFVFLAVSFIPNIWNAAIFAEFEEEKKEHAKRAKANDAAGLSADEDAEATSALVSTFVILLIGFLAYVAGGVGSSLAFENFYGLVLCGVVIGVFAVVVFLDTLSETEFIQNLSRGLGAVARKAGFLARFYNWVDTGFVRIGAAVAGMGHETVLRRYGLLAATLTCLTLLAWYLPAPLGLVPAVLGFVIAISVSRLWSWVEDDRALAAMTEYKYDAPYRVGFREDFRDETLLGFMFLFILLPIMMMQAHVGQIFGPGLFDGAENKTFFDWFGFFGVELAKAVPIVDWAEIYNIRPASDLIQFNSPAAKHTVFLARAMVDLVLIASLLQAIGIATRNRNQKRLFAAGHINRLDEIVERSEMVKAVRACRRNDVGISADSLSSVEAVKAFDLKRLGRDGVLNFRKYNEDRLRYLYWSTKEMEPRVFIAALAGEANRFPLSSAIDQTKEMAQSGQNKVDMIATFTRARAEHDQGTTLIDVDDLYEILSHLRAESGLREFKHKLIDLAIEIGPAKDVVYGLSGLAGGDNADDYQYTRQKIASVITALAGQVDDCEVLREVLKQWEGWTDERPSVGYEATVQALRDANKSRGC